MKNIIEFFRSPLTFPIYFIFGEYVLWALFGPMDYTARLEDISDFELGLILFSIFIIIVIATYASRNNRVFSVLMMLALLPIAGLCLLYVSFSLSEMYNFGWPESKLVYVLALAIATVYPTILVFRALKREGSKAVVVWLFILLLPLQAASIAYPMNFGPEILDTVKSGGYTYHITAQRNSDYHTLYWFYKCKHAYLGCHHLYSSYGMAPELLIDEPNKEVSLLNYGDLVVTDREPPIYYTGISGQLEDKVYILSWDWFESDNCEGYSCRAYIYNLNICNIDLRGCSPLPIQYTTDYDMFPYWEANENTHEISLREDDENGRLIFTYGKHPRCYVEECKILQVQN